MARSSSVLQNNVSVGALGAPTRVGAGHLDLVLQRRNSTDPSLINRNKYIRLNAGDLH